MTITVNLLDEVGRKLTTRALRAGRPVESIAEELIAQGVDAGPTLDAILAPFRQQVAASGLTDPELDALFDEARVEAHRDRQGPTR